MRKSIILILVIAVLLLPSCSRAGNNATTNPRGRSVGFTQGLGNERQRVLRGQDIVGTNRSSYYDGMYTGLGNRMYYGYDRAVVYIKGGKISNVVFSRVNTNDLSRDSIGAGKGKSGPGISKGVYMSRLSKEIIRQQSVNVTVPNENRSQMSNCILAARRALDKAIR